MNQNLTIDEKLNLLLKNQEEIMHHLWNYGSANDLQEQQIIDYIEQKIVPQAESGEVGAEGVLVEMFISWLKTLAIDLAGRALEYLIEKGTDWAVNATDFVLLKLQDFLYDKYLLANDKQKEIFKDKILAKFPNSGLADKLRNE